MTRFPAGSGAALDPAQQFRPVVLMPAYVFRVVVEDALTERREQDVRLGVAKFRNHRKWGALAEFGDGGLAGVGPWLKAIAYKADRQFPTLHPADGPQLRQKIQRRIEVEMGGQDRHEDDVRFLEIRFEVAFVDAGRSIHDHPLHVARQAVEGATTAFDGGDGRYVLRSSADPAQAGMLTIGVDDGRLLSGLHPVGRELGHQRRLAAPPLAACHERRKHPRAPALGGLLAYTSARRGSKAGFAKTAWRVPSAG